VLQLDVEGTPLAFEPRRLLIAGYTGRDQAAVARHIAELREHGIPAPARTPALYALAPDRLTTAERIHVVGHDTSGEVEFVLLYTGGELYIAVGSDHTDRALERLHVARSKQVCPKPISRAAWRWAAVRAAWDRCRLRSEVDGTPYQEGSVAELLPPDAILDLVRQRVGNDLEDSAIFCGTLPLLGGALRCGVRFTAVLAHPDGRELCCAYTVAATDDLDV
jgi:4-hydroxyphenylacetate 3-monooxygenase